MRSLSKQGRAGFRGIGRLALGLALTGAFLSAPFATNAQTTPSQTTPPQTTSTAPANTSTAIAIMQASAAMQADKCDEALAPLAQLWDDASLQQSDPDTAESFRFQRVICTFNVSGIDAALALSEQNIRHVGATLTSYDLHAFLLLSAKRVPEAAAILEEAMTRFPDHAPQLTDITVMATLLSLEDGSTTLSLLNHLERVHWQLHDTSGRLIIDTLRLEGLRAAVISKDKALADLYRADLAGDAYMYALSQGDGHISNPAVPALSVIPMVRQQISDVKTHIAETPTDLEGLNYLISLERSNDEHETALVQLGGIIDLIKENGLDKFDSPGTFPTLIAARATLLADLGKYADALAVYKDGAKIMRGPGTFDFTLSYMSYLIDLGQDREALALESRIDFTGLDADEKAQLATTQACAFAYLKDTPRFNAAIAEARAAGPVDPKPYLCAGDVEGAAAALIARINDEDTRDAAIMQLQEVKPQIPHSERSKAYINGMIALRKRPDVLAAAKAQDIIVRTWPLRFE